MNNQQKSIGQDRGGGTQGCQGSLPTHPHVHPPTNPSGCLGSGSFLGVSSHREIEQITAQPPMPTLQVSEPIGLKVLNL